MYFGHGIGHHHHHRSPSEDEQQPPIYPPPGFRPSSPPPHPHHHQSPYPPPSHVAHEHHGPHPQPFPSIVQHVAHEHHGPLPQPFPSSVHHMDHERHGPQPQPFPSSVQHVAHEHYRPHPQPFPSSVQHVAHETHFPHHPPPHHHHHDRSVPVHHLPQGQHVRVFCQAETEYSLSIRHGSVVLAPRNASDQFQQWIKDEKYSTKVKDKEGFPSFALVNKETGLALQHSIGATQPVRLTPYRPDEFDQSILWTLSKDLGHGFRAVRMVNNIHLNLDAFHGDMSSGGVHDGTVIVVWEWNKGDNQLWKLAPY